MWGSYVYQRATIALNFRRNGLQYDLAMAGMRISYLVSSASSEMAVHGLRAGFADYGQLYGAQEAFINSGYLLRQVVASIVFG